MKLEQNRPFLLRPAFKDYLWGGSKLKEEYGKDVNIVPLAETWECSTHPDGFSIVASGKLSGVTLDEVLKKHPEYLGTHPLKNADGTLPIIVKLIDAKKDLSIQVHPDDEYARIYENGQRGKTELWYVLHAEKEACLVYGFKKELGRKELKKALQDGMVEKFLQHIPVKKNDVFFIEAGTVHAIGQGVVLAEIQENSNLTYRLFDYNRVNKKGNKRELHVEKALDVVKLSCEREIRQPMRVLNYKNGYASELLGRCKYFQVERLLLNTEQCKSMVHFQTGSNSFRVLLCTDGCGVMFGKNVMINFFKGDSIFIPADSIALKLHGKAEMLNISC